MSDAHEAAAFDHILDYLRQSRGFEFSAYKTSSLMRRIRRRMQAINVETFDEYFDYLQIHQQEFEPLFNTILINVTSFFRDPEVWSFLGATVIPAIVSASRETEPIRVWSAGAAGGQEAFSAAMLLADALGLPGFRERVKIYATDVDEEALADARRATYVEKQLAEIPDDLRTRYFERSGEQFVVHGDLRRSVIFGRHDLIQDAPISRINLLLCRNTLMYFNTEAQARIMARFYFSLNPGGFLTLGRAEMLASHATTFVPVDLKRRIFRATPRPSHRDRLLLLAHTGREELSTAGGNHLRLREAASDAGADAEIVLDAAGLLASANAAARRTFGLGTVQMGSPVHELEVSYRPAELRAHLDRVRSERQDVVVRNVVWDTGASTRILDVALRPVFDSDDSMLGTRVTFMDVTPIRALQEQLAHSNQELETAYEELQSTNEELETTNEELQSTVEELETTNEELQSTNEELETMNEELQSANEELHTMNDELRNRGLELNSANSFLEAVFTSLRSAVVVLDQECRVSVWNPGATELWGLRPDEVQRSYFFSLDIGLPVHELGAPIREVLSGNAAYRESTLSSTTRRGRPIVCRVGISPLTSADRTTTGVILLMEEQGRSQQEH